MIAGRAAVFLDRDGVLIQDRVDRPPTLDEIVLLPGVAEAVAALAEADFALMVVTNQAWVGKGELSNDDAHKAHNKLVSALRDCSPGCCVGLYHSRYSPHRPESYRRDLILRKPAPGMLVAAAFDHGLNLASSYMVGDQASDIEAGRRAGVRACVLIRGRETGDCGADYVAEDLAEAATWIVKHRAKES